VNSSSSNFDFLREEWREVFAAAVKAESLALVDARTACFYARRALELAVSWRLASAQRRSM
jgi:type I restriction enzyme R subunit